ncbi:Ketopantoate reductase PanE/ApbA C terminal family protein [Clavispora lusitaniae]|uniref:2-dehydropantoate 2-reductase n=2 Tax=Clavispora lusitaniae TaxID=36911 RepID=C4Y6E2_CLAL4|nr:uncharacterized protein CLUG_03725 [Clavispora lusitaniae ATCC 42720]EEQ39597.1 hypothetical protein CLUG_03725 [Clavispora lusitaniae ATCC 42720]KAF5210472.1 hypothetical protein E0198_003348 [Clavispora lusitaniae]KAF7582431.1 Ketopantoate reductase PanE/ApbA C terminal family protein [Clavispora lusitaniae]OVF10977.1 hypothetical protein A9F13_01g04213 [Clavispora lusitaniae]
MPLPKVLVIGSGGVGTIAALALTLNKKCEVTLVVRSDYEKVIKNGYTIISATYGKIDNWKPQNIVRSVEEAAESAEYDFVVVTTKNIPDGPTPCEEIVRPAIVDGKTVIVLIQNGIEIEKPMIREYPHSTVISGISLIGSANLNGVIHNSHKDSILLSPFHNPNVPHEVSEAQTRKFGELYQNEDESINKILYEESAVKSRWQKLVYNCVLNTVCTIAGLDVNRCQINGANSDIFVPAMNEVIAIAASEGVEVDGKDMYLHIGDGKFYSPSMLVDSRKKQLFELEVILGNPLRVAKANGVSTPILSTLYTLLKMIQFKIKEEKGLIKINEDDYKGKSSDDYPQIFQQLSGTK